MHSDQKLEDKCAQNRKETSNWAFVVIVPVVNTCDRAVGYVFIATVAVESSLSGRISLTS